MENEAETFTPHRRRHGLHQLHSSQHTESPALGYATVSFVVPGLVIEIEPPIVQMHLLVLLSAGMPRTVTVGEPGAQGAATAGTQGVGTPNAAEVRIVQVPKGGMFAIGM
jgi:hypothetical protein